MQNVDYPEFTAYKALHDHLMKPVWSMYERSLEGNEDMSIEVLVLLNDPLTDHILEKDRQIGRFIQDARGHPS